MNYQCNHLHTFVASPPDILSHPTASTVTFFGSVQFSCVIRSYDLSSVIWKKVGSQKLSYTASITNTSSNINEIVSMLTITEVIGYYSGQYFCEAKNSAGTATSSLATLNVNGI